MPKKQIKQEEVKNYDWIVLGRHPSSVLSGCLAARWGAKVLFLPNVGHAFKATRSKIVENLEFDYESGWVGGFASFKHPEEQGLLDLCLKRIDPELMQKWFYPEEQALLFTQDYRILSEDFLDDWVNRFEGGKTKKSQGHRKKILDRYEDLEKELIQTLNKIPSLFHTEIPSKKSQVSEKEKRFKSFFYSKMALSFSSSVGRRLEKKWFLKTHSSLSPVKSRGLNREKWEILAARYSESSGILLNAEDLAQSGACDWACFYASRLRRIKSNINDWVDDLMRIAQTQGARVDQTTELDSILFHANCYSAIEYVPSKQEKVSTGKIRVSSHGLVCGTATPFLERYLKDKKKNRISQKVAKTQTKAGLKGWFFTWAFSAPIGAWEKSLPRRLLWNELGSPPLEWEWGWAIQRKDSHKDLHKEEMVLRARTLMPWNEQTLHIDYLKNTIQQIAAQAHRLFPGVEFSKASQIESEEVIAQLKSIYPWQKLDKIPENLKAYFGAGTGVDSGIEGLFLVNETAYPALGSFGWPVAALESSAWLAHRLGLSGPLMDLNLNQKRTPE